MLCKVGFEFGLLILVKRTYRGGDADVGGELAEFESEVSALCVVLGLLEDLDALNSHEQSLLFDESLVFEIGSVFEGFGIVDGGYGGLFGFDYLGDAGALGDLVGAAVGVALSGDSDFHSYLDTVVGDRVGAHSVNVVSAVAVLHIDAVVGIAL